MPNWKKLIVSGSDASLNSLNATAALTASGLIYPSSDGSSGQVISTDGNGNLSFSTVSGGGTALTISGSSAGGTQVSSNSFTKLQFDSDTGLNLDSIDSGATALISIGSHYRDIIVDGQVTLVATGSDQLELISGTGINITTSTTDTNSNSVSKELAFEVDNTIATTGSNSFVGDQDITGALTASSAQIANLNYPITDGADGQVLTTDGAGNLTFETVEDVYVTVKNVSGGELQKGTPVHATSSQSSGNATPVIAASASDASTMPATFVLNETLADEAEGQALLSGYLQGVDTSLFETGEVVYVGENGGFTNVKPTGSTNLIQNLGIVTKIHASNGSGWVYGSGRSNDVPNLPEGKIWVGSPTYSVTSSVVHLDESNGRVGIGTTSPTKKLHVNGEISGSDIFINDWGSVSASLSTHESSISSLNGVTGSYLLNTTDTLDGDLTVTGTLTAQEFHTEYVSASILYESGSTKFGDTTDDNHDFTGSVIISGSTDLTLAGGTGNATFNVTDAGDLTIAADDDIRLDAGGNDILYRFNGTELGRMSSANSSTDLQLTTSQTNGDILLLPNGSGNVGIGTTSPSAKLDVRSTATNYAATFRHSTATGYAPGSILLEAGQGGSRGQGIYHYNNVADENWFTGVPYNVSSKKWIVANKYSTTQDVDTAQLQYALLTIDSDTGNVGIGTTDPDAKLDVEGDVLIKAANLSNQENTDVDTGTETIATVTHASYDAAFFDYVVKNGTNLRAGTVMAVHDGTNIEFTDNSTKDIGDTSGVTFSVDISGTDLRLRATTTSDNWIIKTLVRSI